MTICARIASSPPVKQNAIADAQCSERHRRQRRALQVGPGAMQPSRGRGDSCREPEVERQRRHGDDRGRGRRDRHQRIDPLFGLGRRRSRVAQADDPQQAPPQRAGDGGGIGAEREQRGHRGQRGKACDPEQDAADRIPFQVRRNRRGAVARETPLVDRPSEQGEMPEPPGRQRDHDGKGDAIGQAEDRAEAAGRRDAADGGAERAPSERRHHQRQRRQIEQQ